MLKLQGQMVCADMVYLDSKDSNLADVENYRQLLQDIGFAQVRVADVTAQCSKK